MSFCRHFGALVDPQTDEKELNCPSTALAPLCKIARRQGTGQVWMGRGEAEVVWKVIGEVVWKVIGEVMGVFVDNGSGLGCGVVGP